MLEHPIPLQADLFTGELVDTRNREQRRADRERQQPQQPLLFSQREIAQFGVRTNPVMPFSPGKLKLVSEDPRSEDEIEGERLREAQRQTVPLFAAEGQVASSDPLLPFIPSIVWITRADLLQHHPEMAVKIDNVGDHELEALGTLLLSALQEFYRVQLDAILTHFC